MEKLELFDKTSFFEAKEMESRWVNIVHPLITRRNSRFITLSFRKGASLGSMLRLVQAFREKLTEASGIHPTRLFTAAIYLTKPNPHVHLIAVGDKDRRTGKSITSMSRAAVEGLFAWWEEAAGNKGEWIAVWESEKLVAYLTGVRNTSRSGQLWAEEFYNEAFLRRLRKRVETRKKIETAGVCGFKDHDSLSPVS